MKMKGLLILYLLLVNVGIFAQPYPLVTLQDIQKPPDSLIGVTDPPSVLNGQIVRVRGLVMVQPVIDPVNNRGVIISAGARWSIYVQDPEGALWGGINVIQHDTSLAAQGTFFDLVDTAQVWEFTGLVEEFNTTTQLALVTTPQPIPVEFISQFPKRPEPIEITLSDFFTPSGGYNFEAEKYEGMYVIFRNIIVSDRNTNGNFKVNDGLGHSANIYNQSRYFKTGTAGIIPGYQPPLNGSVLSYVRGIVTTRTDGYYIVPLYPGDIGPLTASPPIASQITRDVGLVTSMTPVKISAKLADLDGYVTSASVQYRVNSGARISVPMQKSVSDTTIWEGTIPGVPDSSLVDFFIRSVDNEGNSSNTPGDTLKGMYFYMVLNRPLTIRDVQYSPFGSGYSGYNDFYLTLTGVVSADTSDIPGMGSTPLRVYMQDGAGPWSGIQIGTTGNLGSAVLDLKRGDRVTITGKIQEVFNVTRIDSLTSINILSSNNPLPDPQVLTTGTIGTKFNGDLDAEPWESVLIRYNNPIVTNYTADGSSNFGESYVSDGTGNTRVEWQDGNHNYHNAYDSSLIGNPNWINVPTGSGFTSLTGVLYFSFSYYKLVPRKSDDIQGFTIGVDDNLVNPNQYSLSQNYPNPFNPATTIQYSLPIAGNVTLKIYNLLGQEVKTLLNEYQNEGSYKYTFDASHLPSGVYFYVLNSGEYSSVKKMMLLK